MAQRAHIAKLNDTFLPGRRDGLFLRFTGSDAAAEAYFVRLYGEALRRGAIFEGHIPNPSEADTAAFFEAFGQDFGMDKDSILPKLPNWLPGLGVMPRMKLCAELTGLLERMAAEGKGEGIRRNAFVRFLCWLRFRCERLAPNLGQDPLPRLLFQGEPSSFELRFLAALCASGCDVILLLPSGDAAYRKLDPQGELSDLMPAANPFPADFSLSEFYRERSAQSQRASGGIQLKLEYSVPPRWETAPQTQPPHREAPSQAQPPRREASRQPAPGAAQPGPSPALPRADFALRTNAWMDSRHIDCLASVAQPPRERGGEPGQICNCFIRIVGVEDPVNYPSELIQLRRKLSGSGREPVVIEGELPSPTPEEVARVRREIYANVSEALSHLSENLRSEVCPQLQNTARRAFLELLNERAQQPGENLNRVVNAAVYLLCWLGRYASGLLGGWQPGKIGCMILLNGARSEREALFLRFLARLPVDVLLLDPDPDTPCALADSLLFEQRFDGRLSMERFPQESGDLKMRTAASQAERDLDGKLYGAGYYRNRQFARAQSVTLLTTYEELSIYWKADLKFRPNFSAEGDTASIPVLFAQVSGVKDGRAEPYWREIRKFITPNCYLIQGLPHLKPEAPNPFASAAVNFVRDGKLQRERILAHRSYPFALMRDDMQAHLLDKLQALLDRKLIRGTGSGGVEYQIVATVLDLPKELLRMIQKFDFTRRNPKLVCIHTGEAAASRQDAILLAYLNLVGFDLLFFAPTGYHCFSQWFTADPFQEHQLGDFVYDLHAPVFEVPAPGNPLLKLFRRGD